MPQEIISRKIELDTGGHLMVVIKDTGNTIGLQLNFYAPGGEFEFCEQFEGHEEVLRMLQGLKKCAFDSTLR